MGLLQTVRFIRRHPLTRNAPVAALGRFARWQVVSRLRGEIVVDWVGGAKLAVRRGMTGATGNIYCGLHEFAEMGFLLHLLRPGDMFMDVGANVGTYTVLAARVCGASCLAFEPDPGTATGLRRNVALNGIEARVGVHEAALGAGRGEVSFTIGRDTTNRIADTDAPMTRRVRLETLDAVAMGVAPTFIKIDVEGHEAAVLAGAEATLAATSLLAVQTEGHDPVVAARLRASGFERRSYDPFTRVLCGPDGAAGPANVLWVRDEGSVTARLASAPRLDVVGVRL